MAPFAFTGDRLDEQLEQVTRAAVDNPAFVAIDTSEDRTRVRLSKIFDWYAKDWKEDGGARARRHSTGWPGGGKRTGVSIDFQP